MKWEIPSAGVNGSIYKEQRYRANYYYLPGLYLFKEFKQQLLIRDWNIRERKHNWKENLRMNKCKVSQ